MRVGFRTAAHSQLLECIARAGGRRWAKNFNFLGRQESVDIAPLLIWVFHRLTPVGLTRFVRIRNFFGSRQIDLLQREFQLRGTFGICKHNAVETDNNLRRVNAIGLAVLELFFLNRRDALVISGCSDQCRRKTASYRL